MRNYKVILGLRWGELSGVDVFSAHLGAGLIQRGIPTRILFSHSDSSFPLPLASELPVDRLNIKAHHSWGTRWRKMIRYLESQAPCCYIPNYDYNYSCVSPKLSDRVMVLGIVHSDDPVHYEHVRRLGSYWNGIVAVSSAIAGNVIAADENLKRRLKVIPYGVPLPLDLHGRSKSSNRPLKIIYAGRLSVYQKDVLEISKILNSLHESRVPFEAMIVGDGPDRHAFLESCRSLLDQGLICWKGILPNHEVLKLLETQDVMLLTSKFEGLPICILEAMARGCIPVCRKIQSGLPDLIRDGENGFLVPCGDHSSFVSRLSDLQKHPLQRERLSMNAYETIRKNYEIETMVSSYIDLMERCIREAAGGQYHRPAGKILPPPSMKITWKDHLPGVIRIGVRKGRRYLRRTFVRRSK